MEPGGVDWGGLSHSERRRLTAMAGHGHPDPNTGETTARLAQNDPDASVRVVALGALARLNVLTVDDIARALSDPDSLVARRAIECAAPLVMTTPDAEHLDHLLVTALRGPDDAVAEVAAWAIGERHQEQSNEAPPEIVSALIDAATTHTEALVRESAAAALGAVGHSDGLPAILTACKDKATVRRRAVLALAAFDGPEVNEALQRALSDRDWQVRQAAEDLLAIDEIDASGVIDADPSART